MSKILYIEDEVFLAKIVKESLERNDHEVLHLQDGSLTVSEFQRFVPDVCVLDIMLPFKNGYEIATEIRALDNKVPIIFLTAKSQTQDLVTGFKVGGNDYLKKPFSMEELLVRITNLTVMSNGRINMKTLSDGIELGSSFTFYPNKQSLVSVISTKQLSYKESKILELLSKNINGSTERKEILLQIWGDDTYFNSRNLDVYIRKLRNYLSQDSNIEIITLKGVGYHFVCESS